MKKLMFVLVIGLMVSTFGCDDIKEEVISYDVSGESSSLVNITYLDKDGLEQTTNTMLPWSYGWRISSDDSIITIASIVVTKLDENQKVTVNIRKDKHVIVSNDRGIPIKDKSDNILGYVIHSLLIIQI